MENWEEFNFNWAEEDARNVEMRAEFEVEEAERMECMRARENYVFACFDVGAFLNVENVSTNFYSVRWV